MDEIFQMLVEAGADLIHEYYDHILHKCVLDSTINQVRILLNHGVDIYARNERGQTALHCI